MSLDCPIPPESIIEDIDDLKCFMNNNDGGFLKSDILLGCSFLIKYYEEKEEYQFCAEIKKHTICLQETIP